MPKDTWRFSVGFDDFRARAPRPSNNGPPVERRSGLSIFVVEGVAVRRLEMSEGELRSPRARLRSRDFGWGDIGRSGSVARRHRLP